MTASSKPPFAGEARRVRLGDVCEVVHGKNQHSVESDVGTYPIYGSGGRMGYATAYLCPADTVVVGRKGTINRPLLVREPLWNVDTAFGLVADRDVLLPEFLYHFCLQFDFSRLNRAATIPSLTKKSISEIEMLLPSVVGQQEVVARLRAIESLEGSLRRQLSLLDELVKSRFVEMFGDPDLKDRGFETAFGTDLFKIGNGKSRPASKRFNEGVPAYGGNGVSWYTDETLVDFDTIVIGRVGRHCGNTRLVEAPFWVTDNAMYIKEFKRDCFDKVFLINLMNIIGFNRFADEGDLWKISQKPFVEYEYPIPPLSLQREFASFAAEVAKSQVAVRQQIERLQTLYDSLAQEYFG